MMKQTNGVILEHVKKIILGALISFLPILSVAGSLARPVSGPMCQKIFTEDFTEDWSQFKFKGDIIKTITTGDGSSFSLHTYSDPIDPGRRHRLFMRRPGDKKWKEISPFSKENNGRYPLADIDYVVNDTGLFIGYFRVGNKKHALLVFNKNSSATIEDIEIPLGSPSRILTNLGSINWSTPGYLNFKPIQSYRKMGDREKDIYINQSSERIAKALKAAIEYHALPNLIFSGIDARPSQNSKNADTFSVLLRSDNPNAEQGRLEIESFLYEFSDIYGSQFIKNNLESLRPDYHIANVQIYGELNGKKRKFDNLQQAKDAYSNDGYEIHIAIISFETRTIRP